MGQRWLTIHPTLMEGVTRRASIRKRRILFGISLSQRIRDIPNDKFGTIAYTETLSMVDALEELIPIIESNTFFNIFKSTLDLIPILPANTDPPYDPLIPPSGLPPRYQLSDSFVFVSMNLDPKHLYPSDFLTRSGNDKEQLYDKLAGYQMTAVFESPEFQETYPPLQCKPPYVL